MKKILLNLTISLLMWFVVLTICLDRGAPQWAAYSTAVIAGFLLLIYRTLVDIYDIFDKDNSKV